MADWLIVSTERAGEKLLKEAQKRTPWPRQLLDKSASPQGRPRIIFLARDGNVNLFEHILTKPSASVSCSVWDQLRPRRRSKASKSKSPPAGAPRSTTRVFGTTHLYTSIQHFMALLGPRSMHSSLLLHPDASLMLHVHTLLKLGQEHACLRTIAMPPTSSMRESRDVLVVEYRNQFQLPTNGRKGFVAAYHSVNWSGCPGATLPEAVRASAYTSGIVALESATVAGRLELYCVADTNLKGTATARDSAEFTRQRVQLVLARTTAAVEQTVIGALTLDADNVFEIARRTSVYRQQQACVTCQRSASQPTDAAKGSLLACRKCYAPVCGECCLAWRHGRQELQFCVACWHKANAAVGA